MSGVCQCQLDYETVEHFLLFCPLHETHRREMFRSVNEVYGGRITEEVLLGGSSESIVAKHKVEIAEAVYRFVLATGAEV